MAPVATARVRRLHRELKAPTVSPCRATRRQLTCCGLPIPGCSGTGTEYNARVSTEYLVTWGPIPRVQTRIAGKVGNIGSIKKSLGSLVSKALVGRALQTGSWQGSCWHRALDTRFFRGLAPHAHLGHVRPCECPGTRASVSPSRAVDSNNQPSELVTVRRRTAPWDVVSDAGCGRTRPASHLVERVCHLRGTADARSRPKHGPNTSCRGHEHSMLCTAF